jgi:hypothetical protein
LNRHTKTLEDENNEQFGVACTARLILGFRKTFAS